MGSEVGAVTGGNHKEISKQTWSPRLSQQFVCTHRVASQRRGAYHQQVGSASSRRRAARPS